MSLFKTVPTTGDFASLFRLLDDYDVHRANRGRPSSTRFTPPFDVRECPDAFHLDGELPGVSQKDIDIEFSDPQTIVIKGRVERQYDKETEQHAHTGGHTHPVSKAMAKAAPSRTIDIGCPNALWENSTAFSPSRLASTRTLLRLA